MATVEHREHAGHLGHPWIPIPAHLVMGLPQELYDTWPEPLRPTAVSCALSARHGRPGKNGGRLTADGTDGTDGTDGIAGTDGTSRAMTDGTAGDIPELLITWVRRAAVVLGSAGVLGHFYCVIPGLRLVVAAGVLASDCCVVWRWEPWEESIGDVLSTSARASPSGSGYLLGRIDRAHRLPDLVAGLIPRAASVNVLGTCGVRGGVPAPWTVHVCQDCPHDGSSLGEPAQDRHAADRDLQAPAQEAAARQAAARQAVTQMIRADLLRACMTAAGETPGGRAPQERTPQPGNAGSNIHVP